MKHTAVIFKHINLLLLAALKIPIAGKWKIISEYIIYPNCWKDVTYAGKPQTFNSTSGLSGSKRASTSLRFTSSKLDGFHLGF